MWQIILTCIPVLLLILYAISLAGRRAGGRIAPFYGWAYAHRGLHDASAPENSMEAFQKALDSGGAYLKDGATVIIKGIGNYTGEIRITFVIIDAS